MDSSLGFEPLPSEENERLSENTDRIYVDGFSRSSDGILMPTEYVQVTQAVRDFEVRPDDVWVVTFPKCGTTWTQEMTWLISNDLDFATAKSVPLHERFPFFELTTVSSKYSEVVFGAKVPLEESLTMLKNSPSPRFIKTHLPLNHLPKQLWTVKPKIFYVAREVKDVIVSYFHHNRLMVGYKADFETFCQDVMKDNIIWCPFWTHVLDFWRLRNEPNILFLTYEEMQRDLASVAQKTARFLGKELRDEEVQNLCNHLSFKEMKANKSVNFEVVAEALKEKHISSDKDCHFMRKGKSGSWRELMSEKLAAEVDAWTAERLKGTGYECL